MRNGEDKRGELEAALEAFGWEPSERSEPRPCELCNRLTEEEHTGLAWKLKDGSKGIDYACDSCLAVLESYAGMMPDALDSLAPEDRARVYAMLRLKVEILAEGTMQARGILGDELNLLRRDGERLCETELTPGVGSKIQNYLS